MQVAQREKLQLAGRAGSDRGPWSRLVELSRSRRTGYVLMGLSAVAFVVLAILALFGESLLLRVDQPIQREILESRTGWLNRAMAWISLLGTRYVIGAVLLTIAGWVLVTGRCRRVLGVLATAFVANFALEAALKWSIARPRPEVLQLVPGRGYSFPSGHVLATVGFYGTLAAVAWSSTSKTWARAGAYVVATAIILAVGFSRMYLGVHWFSDVVAGFLVGTAFVLIVAWALQGHHLGRLRSCCGRHLRAVA